MVSEKSRNRAALSNRARCASAIITLALNCVFSIPLIVHVFPCSKREEIQKRVAEAKAAQAREEQDKKERQLEDERQMVYASKKARKKREHGKFMGLYSRANRNVPKNVDQFIS
jgi:hypothetical protein